MRLVYNSLKDIIFDDLPEYWIFDILKYYGLQKNLSFVKPHKEITEIDACNIQSDDPIIDSFFEVKQTIWQRQ